MRDDNRITMLKLDRLWLEENQYVKPGLSRDGPPGTLLLHKTAGRSTFEASKQQKLNKNKLAAEELIGNDLRFLLCVGS